MIDELKNMPSFTRDAKKVEELHNKKFEAWTRLRESRAEMKRIDVEMIRAGASAAELEHLCW